jgi:2-C-methyl-D-erythritol 4-phosphate cytidylyltransferase
MNISLIIAAGIGSRMGQDIPKQFMHIDDKPIIIYTLEAFQRHPEIDEICVVCLDGWHDMLRAYARQFTIDKLKIIVNGGTTGQESIKNGIMALAGNHSENDIVLIHEAVFPLVSQDIISDAIRVCSQYGLAAATVRLAEVPLVTDDWYQAKKTLDRDKIARSQVPHTFLLKKLLWAHAEATRRKIANTMNSLVLMTELGETIHLSLGSEKNIKLTTSDDIEIFRALLRSEKEKSWYKKELCIV